MANEAGTRPVGQAPRAPHAHGWTVWALDEWRRSMGLGHQAFAVYLEHHESWWSRLRNGERTLLQRDLIRIARLRPEIPLFAALDVWVAADGGAPPPPRAGDGTADGGA